MSYSPFDCCIISLHLNCCGCTDENMTGLPTFLALSQRGLKQQPLSDAPARVPAHMKTYEVSLPGL